MRHFIALVAISFVGPLYGQKTWNGLQFGSTVAEVRTALQGKFAKDPVTETTPSGKVALQYDGYKVQEYVVSARLMFGGAGGKLDAVVLGMADPYREITDKAVRLGKAARTADALSEMLASKYGVPVHSEGQCSPTAAMLLNPLSILTCKKTWKNDGQLIRLYWRMFGEKFFLNVEYGPVPAEL